MELTHLPSFFRSDHRLAVAKRLLGIPIRKHISTSFAERQNLSVRMGLRRYTRLTNAFSRKLENHAAAVALYYSAYNFVEDPPNAVHEPRHGLWRD
jgi:hypothetical protein